MLDVVALPNWQIGVDAAHLITLRNPAQPTPAPTLVGGSHTSIAGGRTLDVISKKWTTVWSWENIPTVDYLTIKAWWDGTHGNGPFAVVDPTIDPAATVVRTMNVTDFQPNPTIYFGLWSPELTLEEI